MNDKVPAVYIMTNKRNGTLYTGVTSNLQKRVYEHKHNTIDGFTKTYNLHILVYYKTGESMIGAIEMEKNIKAGSRKNKLKLIEDMNPEWRDLYGDL